MIAAKPRTSRPLRAVGFVLGGWTTARVFTLWPGDVAIADPSITTEPVHRVSLVIAPLDSGAALYPPRDSGSAFPTGTAHAARSLTLDLDDSDIVRTKPTPDRDVQLASSAALAPPESAPFADSVEVRPAETDREKGERRSRLTGTTWALLRQGSAPSLASGGQLAGSQAGIRIYYEPGPKGLALTARVSSPLASRDGREAAIGVALRHNNVGLIVEQRIALEARGRDRPAAIAFGGVYDVSLPAGLRLDAYAQAGVVGVKSPDLFVDGAASIARPVVRADGSSVSVGAGVWGGAQPGVSRLDVGPQVVARVAVAKATLRVSAEWRERIAGNAAPASGPAVAVGFDF